MVKTVIWADDNQTFRESMIAQLERFCKKIDLEIKVDEASDGRELVEKVLAGDYDLVFTDNIMQEVYGLQAIAQIRARNITVPIYMISSRTVGKKAVELGATGYLDKRDLASFQSEIEKVISTHFK